MSSQRYPEEFKTEAVKQILDHGHSVADVSNRLGVSTHSLYKWLRERQMPLAARTQQLSQSDELRHPNRLAQGAQALRGLLPGVLGRAARPGSQLHRCP